MLGMFQSVQPNGVVNHSGTSKTGIEYYTDTAKICAKSESSTLMVGDMRLPEFWNSPTWNKF